MTQQHYESWRISYQSSESAARAAWKEMIRLHHRVNELESAIKKQIERSNSPLLSELRRLEEENAALKAAPAAQAVEPAAVEESREELAKRLISDVKAADAIATAACKRVAELADRDSPEGWPEAMLVTHDELHMIVREAVIEAQTAPAHPAVGVPVQVVELEVDDLIDRLLNAQQDLNLAANVHMDQSIASASTLLDEVEIALRTLAATPAAGELATLQAGLQAAAPNAPLYDPREVAFSAQPAAQGMDAAQAKKGDTQS